MIASALAVIAAALALGPALLFLRNLALYVPPRPLGPRAARRPDLGDRTDLSDQADGITGDFAAAGPAVSVLIPARDEEAVIEAAVRSALASEGASVDVAVMDDGSTDATADIVRGIAAADARVRLLCAPPLPAGWCGKQHACWHLAAAARHPVLLFVDADVRLAPDAAARAAGFLGDSGAALASGVPRQLTVTWAERLVLPLIHFVLLAFLPLARMRRSRDPAYGAGCGQLMVAAREPYLAAGGHRAIRASRHDGLALPRALRAAGFATDLFDATPLATCRMYRSAREVWLGLAKNATEGLGSPRLIVPATALLVGGQVAPWCLAAAGLGSGLGPAVWGPALAGVVASLVARLAAARRFEQGRWAALLHPLGVVVLVAIQWYALALRALSGRAPAWKGRLAT